MHVLFVHQNFPAQFGQIARRLVSLGHRCSFLTERARPTGWPEIEYYQYTPRGGATTATHYCSRSFENAIWRAHAVYETARDLQLKQPDLIVAHSGFGSSLFLRDLFAAPLINYFEYFYHPYQSDMDFRRDFPVQPEQRLRARARNAMILLDLENCDAAYAPTHWQQQRFPQHYHEKIQVIFDGIDTDIWRPVPRPAPQFPGRSFPAGARFVTYVSRGLESMRGFDLFMQAARLVTLQRRDVYFVIVGEDRCCYGGDELVTGMPSFKQWVLSRDQYDLDRFLFLGRVAPSQLVGLFALADVHVYLTVPFVLSWSLFNALACGVPVIASATPPVTEVIREPEVGWLVDFFDREGLAERMMAALDCADELRRTSGAAGRELVQQRYSLDACLPQHLALLQSVANK